MNILIVDDHAINRRLLVAQLSDEAFTVFQAADGVEALAVLEREKIDAIISDILMPRMDGYRLCHEVRSSERWHALPFIIYTATYTSPDDEKVSLELGADRFLRKPAGAAQIVESLQDAIALHAATPRSSRPAESTVLKLYSERLVRKLEQRNLDLEAARNELARANASLELRVRARTADLEAANERLEKFAYFVAHELRAPLRSVAGFSDILVQDFGASLPEEGRALLDRVQRGADTMGRLIDGLLKLGKIGQQALREERLDANAIVRSALDEIPAPWSARSGEVIVGNLPPVRADPGLLKQVFANLIANALKFTSREPAPRIEIGVFEKDGATVFFVKDNGVGFDMACADNLFGAFQRLHDSATFEGTGLGLSIVRNIVHRHAGEIWAESSVDAGATFYFTLSAAAPKL